jgi:hypothetical protein
MILRQQRSGHASSRRSPLLVVYQVVSLLRAHSFEKMLGAQRFNGLAAFLVSNLVLAGKTGNEH